MLYPNTTPVPNAVFDVYLSQLNMAEPKVLLVIIRQTLGWQDSRAVLGRKERDWISGSQLQVKTGCSRRAISSATDALITKNLIEVLDDRGTLLDDPAKRRGKQRLYYRTAPSLAYPVEKVRKDPEYSMPSDAPHAKFAQDLCNEVTALAQKMRITKETLNKTNSY